MADTRSRVFYLQARAVSNCKKTSEGSVTFFHIRNIRSKGNSFDDNDVKSEPIDNKL